MNAPGHPDRDFFGLACWSGPAHVMPRAHRHDDIEVNVVVTGRLDYLFGGRRVRMPAGTASIFWAALPHQVVATESGSTAHWLTVPLDTVLRWRLSENVIGQLLGGVPLVGSPPMAAGPRGPGATDVVPDHLGARQRFDRWTADLDARDPEVERIALLEIEAYLRRALRVARPTTESGEGMPAGGRASSRAAAMATFVAARFRDPLAVADVAAVVHLNPHYAMQVFRAAVGTTIGGYLTQCRLAEAQRLLITSQLTVASVAAEAGFGSASRLYAACQEAGLPTPGAYRRLQQRAAGWSAGAPDAAADVNSGC